MDFNAKPKYDIDDVERLFVGGSAREKLEDHRLITLSRRSYIKAAKLLCDLLSEFGVRWIWLCVRAVIFDPQTSSQDMTDLRTQLLRHPVIYIDVRHLTA